MKNIGGSYGGALTAGLFLQEFVDGAPWVHLDIAGPARAKPTTATSPRAAPGSACARWSSSPADLRAVAARVIRRAVLVAAGDGARRRRARGLVSRAAAWSRGRAGRRRCTRPSPSTSGTTPSTPADFAIEEGTTVRWINDGRNNHNVTPTRGRLLRQRQPEAGALVRAHVPGRRHVRVLLHAPRHARPADSAATLGVGDATAGHARRADRRERRAAAAIEASGRTIRVPADAQTIQAAVDRARQGDLVLVSPGVYKESVNDRHRRDRAPRRRPQPHHPRRGVRARRTACSWSAPTASRSRT